MTRSVSGSPLATPCRNSRSAGSATDCSARTESGMSAAEAAARCMNVRRVIMCLVILMHVRDACISARGSVAQKDVEGDRCPVCLAQIAGDEIARHVSADAETCIALGPQVAHVTDRECADLRLAMAMKDAKRMKACIENILGDRFDAPVHRVARPQLHAPFQQIRLEVA